MRTGIHSATFENSARLKDCLKALYHAGKDGDLELDGFCYRSDTFDDYLALVKKRALARGGEK